MRGAGKMAHNMASKALLTPLLKREWRRASSQEPTSARLTEYAVALRWLAERYPSSLVDVGPGPGSWPHLLARAGIAVTAIDNMESPERGRFLNRHWFFNRHYYVLRRDIRKPLLRRQFDCVTCLSVLELVEDHDAAVHGLFSLLKPGGFLILSFPYNDEQFVDNAYHLPGAAYGKNYPFICRQYSRSEVDSWLMANGGQLIASELYRCFTGEFWAAGQRVIPPARVGPDEPHHLACMCIRKDGS